MNARTKCDGARTVYEKKALNALNVTSFERTLTCGRVRRGENEEKGRLRAYAVLPAGTERKRARCGDVISVRVGVFVMRNRNGSQTNYRFDIGANSLLIFQMIMFAVPYFYRSEAWN